MLNLTRNDRESTLLQWMFKTLWGFIRAHPTRILCLICCGCGGPAVLFVGLLFWRGCWLVMAQFVLLCNLSHVNIMFSNKFSLLHFISSPIKTKEFPFSLFDSHFTRIKISVTLLQNLTPYQPVSSIVTAEFNLVFTLTQITLRKTRIYLSP